MEKIEQLKTMVASFEDDAEKFYKKQNSAAGTRLRKAMQEIRNKAKEIRLEITVSKAAAKKAAPVKVKKVKTAK